MQTNLLRTILIIFNRNLQISIADEAWSKKDYLKFIGALEQIDSTSLTNTYLLKYEFAKKKLESKF